MTVPTNFYTQQASLLPTGLQSLISNGSLAPTANPSIPQSPMQSMAVQQFLQAMGSPQGAPNYNQMAQQGAPIYQLPAVVPPPQQIMPPQQPMGPSIGQGLVRPTQGNSFGRVSIQ